MKINTKFCKEILKAEYKEDGWKREKKYKNDKGEVCRVFTNGNKTAEINTGKNDASLENIELIVDGGSGAKSKANIKKVPKNKFLFAIAYNSEEWYNPSHLVIYIGTVKNWEDEGCLDDYYSDRDWNILAPVLEELKLSESMESIYQADFVITKEELTKQMLERGFKEDVEFTEAMTSDDETEEECIEGVKRNEAKQKEDDKKEKERLVSRSDLEVYVDENINEALAYLPFMTEVNMVNFLVKYVDGKQNMMLVAPVTLSNGQEYVPRFEYAKATLVNERSYDMVKEILDAKKNDEENRLKVLKNK
jgi:hypothetical protein